MSSRTSYQGSSSPANKPWSDAALVVLAEPIAADGEPEEKSFLYWLRELILVSASVTRHAVHVPGCHHFNSLHRHAAVRAGATLLT
jgi:hypothetical protein